MTSTATPVPFPHTDGLSRAGRHITLAVRNGQDLAVLLVHVHDFERLCASMGHVRAGQVLDDFHNQLLTIARDNDAIERIGECRFAVLLNGLRNRGHVSLAAQKIHRLAQKVELSSADQSALSTTIGIALCPEQGEDPHELMRSAEIATLDGRRKNDSVSFFEAYSADKLLGDWDLEARLAKALELGDLDLHYQPKVSLRTNEIVGAEALMRWHDPAIGSISPDIFVVVAEEAGQIVDLTQFAIQRACRQLSEWRGVPEKLGIAVNISPSIIQNLEIIDVLQNATSIWGIRPESLTMEVTENALMADPKTSHDVLVRIREFGARVSIDDFGTGYSSLAYLKDIPADELKIDRSFVMGMMTDSGDHKIVSHSIQIAKSFGLSVVAEGIEDLETLEELRQLGCDFAQGYFIQRPLPAMEFESFCSASGVATDVAGVSPSGRQK